MVEAQAMLNSVQNVSQLLDTQMSPHAELQNWRWSQTPTTITSII